MRTPFIAGNWKMNLGRPEAKALAEELRASLEGLKGRDLAVFPTHLTLAEVSDLLHGSGLAVGGQNLWHEEDGAFTGEVSGGLLRSAGAEYVLVGHSERRQLLGESDALTALKLQAALRHDLRPILCVGETLEEREAGATSTVVRRQLDAALEGFDVSRADALTIAYEPVWAIGTGRTATPEMAQEVHADLRSRLAELVGEAAESIRIQYGGSVKPDNVDALMAMPDIDGALVGGASLKAGDFARIARFE